MNSKIVLIHSWLHFFSFLLDSRCSSSYSAMMSLTGCNRTEFSCKDASCVPMVERCDGKANCKDASDEENCKYMIYCL